MVITIAISREKTEPKSHFYYGLAKLRSQGIFSTFSHLRGQMASFLHSASIGRQNLDPNLRYEGSYEILQFLFSLRRERSCYSNSPSGDLRLIPFAPRREENDLNRDFRPSSIGSSSSSACTIYQRRSRRSRRSPPKSIRPLFRKRKP